MWRRSFSTIRGPGTVRVSIEAGMVKAHGKLSKTNNLRVQEMELRPGMRPFSPWSSWSPWSPFSPRLGGSGARLGSLRSLPLVIIGLPLLGPPSATLWAPKTGTSGSAGAGSAALSEPGESLWGSGDGAPLRVCAARSSAPASSSSWTDPLGGMFSVAKDLGCRSSYRDIERAALPEATG